MKGYNSIRTNLSKMLVKIDPQVTKLDCFKRKMCSQLLFVMGFRDNYCTMLILKSDKLDQQCSLKYRHML